MDLKGLAKWSSRSRKDVMNKGWKNTLKTVNGCSKWVLCYYSHLKIVFSTYLGTLFLYFALVWALSHAYSHGHTFTFRAKKKSCAIIELLTVRVQLIQGESDLNYCKMLSCQFQGCIQEAPYSFHYFPNLKVNVWREVAPKTSHLHICQLLLQTFHFCFIEVFKEGCSLGFTCRNIILWQVVLKYSHYAAANTYSGSVSFIF